MKRRLAQGAAAGSVPTGTLQAVLLGVGLRRQQTYEPSPEDLFRAVGVNGHPSLPSPFVGPVEQAGQICLSNAYSDVAVGPAEMPIEQRSALHTGRVRRTWARTIQH